MLDFVSKQTDSEVNYLLDGKKENVGKEQLQQFTSQSRPRFEKEPGTFSVCQFPGIPDAGSWIWNVPSFR